MAIICRGNEAAPTQLKDALARRGFRVEETQTTYMAIGLAVQHARRDGSGKVVVVLVQPATLARPHELVAALSNSAPSAVCWICRKAGSGMELRAVSEADVAAWRSSGKIADAGAVTAVAAASSGKPGPVKANENSEATYDKRGNTPSLRLAGDWQGDSEVPQSGAPESPVLTDEELAMLLGDESSAAEPGT
ncbi:MAG: hypothetical protein KF691_12930 [Phycisphaeraceae bacterium]|nr:hypothetical protein [Phycisphaeraceae bacterium]